MNDCQVMGLANNNMPSLPVASFQQFVVHFYDARTSQQLWTASFTLQCIIGLENVWNLTLCSNWQVLPKPVRKNNIKNVEVCGLSACLLSISSIVLTVLVSLDVVSVQSWHMMFDMFICWGLTKVICLIVFCWQIWPLCDDSKKKDDPS